MGLFLHRPQYINHLLIYINSPDSIFGVEWGFCNLLYFSNVGFSLIFHLEVCHVHFCSMFGILHVVIVSLSIWSYSNADYKAIFKVPFEIIFSNVNEFRFNIDYLENFIEATSFFFSVQNDNITISFIRSMSGSNNTYIHIGFTVNVITSNNENRIRDSNSLLYHTWLLSRNNLPNIIGINAKYRSCSYGKYSTFYHDDIKCQWICDHLSIYINQTSACRLISNSTNEIYIKEQPHNQHQIKFIGYGNIFSLLCFGCFYCMVRKDKIA